MATETSASPSGGASTQDRPRSFNARELREREFRPVRWIVPDLLPEGLAVLAGRPKTGKSWLTLDLALAIAQDAPVLYLALEDPDRRLRSRMDHLLAETDEPPEMLEFHTTWPDFGKGGGLEAVEHWIAGHPGARAVFIDTLARVRPDRRVNEDIYLGDNQVWGRVQQLASRHPGLLVLGNHHLRKGTAEDVLDLVLGSQGLVGSVDTVMILQRARGEDDGSLFVTGRDVNETSRGTSCRDGVWYIGGEAAIEEATRKQRKLLDLLAENGPMTGVELAALAEEADHTVRQRLHRMARKELVLKADDRWTLGETDETHETDETSRRLARLVIPEPEWTWEDLEQSILEEARREEHLQRLRAEGLA